MRTRIGLVLASLVMLSLACASGGPKGVTVKSENDAIVATQEYDQGAEAVLQALRQTLGPYGFVVTKTDRTDSGIWSLSVKKGVGNLFPEEVTRFVVQGADKRPTLIHILVRTSFFSRWPDEPEWADGFFTSVYENIR